MVKYSTRGLGGLVVIRDEYRYTKIVGGILFILKYNFKVVKLGKAKIKKM